MALDHVRIYFSDAQVSAVDPGKTNLVLFLVRWVTHYCAPGFYLLAGAAIWLYCRRLPDLLIASRFLLTRGLWLIVLELTLIGFAWSFNPGWSWFGVIWSLGVSFILMAFLIHVPLRLLLWGSAAIIFLHAIPGDWYFDRLSGRPGPFATFLYVGGPVQIPLLGPKGVLYSIFPWAAMMSFGFALGPWFLESASIRRRRFLRLGFGMIAAFLLLRIGNFYGNPTEIWSGWSGEFSVGDTVARTVINLLNTDKYPPSPQFALMTLGPIFVALGLLAPGDEFGRPRSFAGVFNVVGRVPMFYYVTHLYLIHGLALGAALLTGSATTTLFWSGAYPQLRPEEGYGYGNGTVLLIWLGVCWVLFLACRWYLAFQDGHSYRWLRYA